MFFIEDILITIISILYMDSTTMFEEESIRYLKFIKKLMIISKHWYSVMSKYYFRDINNISRIGFVDHVSIKHQGIFSYLKDLVSSGKAYISGSRALAFFNNKINPNDIDFYVPFIYKDTILEIAKPDKYIAFVGHLSIIYLIKYSKIDVLIINEKCTIKDAINIFDLDCVKCYITSNRVYSLVPQFPSCTIIRTMCKTTPNRIEKYKRRGYKSIIYAVSVNRCNFHYLNDNWDSIMDNDKLSMFPRFNLTYYNTKIIENIDHSKGFVSFIRDYSRYLYKSKRYVLSSILAKIFGLVFYGE